jgi:hypothetical protein
VSKVIPIAATVAAMLLTGTAAEAEPAAGTTYATAVTAGVELPPLGPEDLVDVVRSVVGERLADVVPPIPRTQLYVDPAGNDANDGSITAPLLTIQAALNKATPGTRINLAPGEYRERPRTVVNGLPDAPIVIKGPQVGTGGGGRGKAVLYGTSRIFNIDHSNYILDGFTIDGQEALKDVQFPADIRTVNAFKDSVQPQVKDGRLIYIGSADTTRDITGVKIINMVLRRGGGECVRMRNNAHHNMIVHSLIEYCGVFGKKDPANPDRFGYHNGEGVYIGTSPGSTSQPMYKNDTSSQNIVVHNTIRTFGSECFNVKENAHDNFLLNNVCSDNTEPTEFQGSNVELRGPANVVKHNEIVSSAGVGVKIKPDSAEFDKGGNVVTDNEIGDAPYALQFNSLVPQGPMCGNTVTTKEPVFFNNTGDYGDGATPPDIAAPC